MDHFKTGDRVIITFELQTTEGQVLLASANGRSLMLAFEELLGGYVGLMPVLWSDEAGAFVDLIQQRKIEIRARVK